MDQNKSEEKKKDFTSVSYYVDDYKVNMREAPNKNATVIYQLNKGDKVETQQTDKSSEEVIEKINGETYPWEYVKYQDNKGWVWGKHLLTKEKYEKSITEANKENESNSTNVQSGSNQERTTSDNNSSNGITWGYVDCAWCGNEFYSKNGYVHPAFQDCYTADNSEGVEWIKLSIKEFGKARIYCSKKCCSEDNEKKGKKKINIYSL